jgi:transcriptional regulator with XRE-family HTH domain
VSDILSRMLCRDVGGITGVLVSCVVSAAYGESDAAILPRMDLLVVRRQLLAERKARGYTQDEVAEDADVGQATISRLEDLRTEMAEIEFETIRKIVENGLGMTLTAFFGKIDGLQAAAPTGIPDAPELVAPPTAQVRHGRAVPAESPALATTDLERYARAFGRALVEVLRSAAREQGARAPRPRRKGGANR